MGAKRKTVLKGFNYMYCDDFAKYLSDMSAKGWHFKEWGVGLKFEKGEPEQAVYAVEVFQKASDNDMRPEPNTQEFAEYCESAGWKFLDAKQKYCIFKKIDENALELFTPEERVTNAFKGTVSGTALLLLFLYGLNAVLQWSKLHSSFEAAIFSGGYLFSLATWTVMFLGQLTAFVQVFWKKNRLMKGICFGEEVYLGIRKDGKFHLRWNDVYIGVLVLLLMYYFYAADRTEIIIINAVIVVGTIVFAVILNKIRPEHDTSVMMQVGFAIMITFAVMMSMVISISGDGTDMDVKKENLPVQVTDYRESKDEIRGVSYYHEENVLGSAERYFVYGAQESLRYYVYRSPYTGILDKVWEDIIYGKKYNEDAEDCTEEWDAQKAIRNKIGTYYVRFENVILEFSDYEEGHLSEDQIDIILDGLELR